ncbi:MAG: FkbM family methyltransferase [Alphaproteobacteria bacterium]|nr:FkbM family methyltransferase [Alphaproteobacteria bacterium]
MMMRFKIFMKRMEDYLFPPRLAFYLKRLGKGKFYSLNKLDQQLLEFIDYENGYFVELGANDGITQANTAHFEKHKGWSGLLIEPIPSKFLECVRNRSDKNHFVCGACVGFDYKEKFVELIYSDLMTISKELSGRDDAEEHAEKGLNVMKSHETNFTFGAKAYTLTSLLKEAKAPQSIDLLSLDVEGAELEVLKGIDFETYDFKYMLIECWDKDGITQFLKEKGYKVAKQLSRHDYLFSK